MNDLDRTACLAEVPLQNPVAQRLCDEFEAAWMRALVGSGPRPLLKTYLERGPTAELVALQRALAQIEQMYQQRLSAAAANPNQVTIEVRDVDGSTRETSDPRADADAVIDVRAASNPSATIDPAPCADANTTLDPAPAADPAATLDPAPVADPAATIDPADMGDGNTAYVANTPVPRGRSTVTPRGSGEDGTTLDQAPQISPTQTVDFGSAAGKTGVDSTDFTFGGPEDAAAADDTGLIAGHAILGELGRGGMGVVYKARQVKLNRIVALKMVLAGAHAGTEQLARFQTEAEAVARLHHANVVQIYEVGEHDGLPFFSLEYVDGGSLAAKIGGTPQDPSEAARMVERLADAMDSAHRQSIIHRDLKPANVLLTAAGDPKITDFGLAKRLEGDSSQTRSGTLMGTPSYMAPEQARGDTKNIGPLSDLYALGAILYEMLTGRPPFQGTTIVEVLDLVQKQEPVPPRRLQPNVPRDLETICLKCLQKEPAQRYASAGDLAAELLRFLAGEPIMARPVGRVEKAWRWCRRNPRVAGLTAAVVVLFVTAGAAIAVLGINAANENAEAAERQARAQKAIEDLQTRTEQKIEQATMAFQTGNAGHAADLLKGADAALEADDLADVRTKLHTLQAQIALYTDFQKLLDRARYAGLFGVQNTPHEARDYCRQLIQLYDAIEQQSGPGACGLPPLNAEQKELFQEDEFEAFLLAAWVENNSASGTGADAVKAAARQGIQWLNRAEKLLPPTRVLYAHRSAYQDGLGDAAARDKDRQRALEIAPTSAVDHFWHGIADRLRASAAQSQGDLKGAQEHYQTAIAEYAALVRMRPEHFWAYLDWASCQFALRNYPGALVGYTACIHLKPETPWPYHNRGTTHAQLKQYGQAIQDYTTALKLDPQAIDTYVSRAQTYLAQGSKEQALEDFGRAIELDPKRAPTYFQRAEAYRNLKQWAEALGDYDRAIQLNAQHAEAYTNRGLIYLAQKQSDQAIDSFGKAIEANHQHAPAYLQRAETYRNSKRFSEALEDYGQALVLNPKDAQACLKRAQTYQDLKQSDDALRDYGQAIALSPEDPRAYLGRAAIFLARGDYAKVRDDYSAAIRLQANDPGPLRVRGVVNLAFLRDLDAALADWSELARLQPKSAEPVFRVAAIRLGRRQYEPALQALERAKALDPKYTEVSWALAQIHHWQGKLDEAVKDVNPVVDTLPPGKPEGLNVRGDIYRTMGRLDEAAADYKRLMQLKPKMPDAYISLAMVYEKQGRPEKAVECYEQMVAQVASAKAYLCRAEFRRNRGQFTDALADCAEAARREPKLVLVDLVRASIDACRKHHHEAVADTERLLAAAATRDGQMLYAAACVFSLASRGAAAEKDNADAPRRAKLYAERGLALLAETLDKGFHDLIYPEHNRMVDDPALAPLRDDPRGSALLAHRS